MTPKLQLEVPVIVCSSMAEPPGSGRESSLKSSTIATENVIPTLALPGDSLIQYTEDSEKIDSEYQVLWNNVMEEGKYRSSSNYKHVAVLLISWAEDCDDLHTKKEVDKLGKVFRETFNYNVTLGALRSNSKKTAQSQVNLLVAKFVDDEDDEDTLLIVYYAGHGIPGPILGQLQLFGKSKPTEDQKRHEMGRIVWNLAEPSLQVTRSDVFVIFDCCYANDLGGNRGLWPRKFEYLAATSKETTKRPGLDSFTSALIYSLTDLAEKRKRFTSSELVNAIRAAPNFPRDQFPALSERGGANARERIMLAPLPKTNKASPILEIQGSEGTGGRCIPDRAHQEIVTLKFFFESRPEKREIEILGRELNAIMRTRDLRVCRIMWGGLRSLIREYADKFTTIQQRRKRRQSTSLPPLSPDLQTGRLYNFQEPVISAITPPLAKDSYIDQHLPRAVPSLRVRSTSGVCDAVLSLHRPPWYSVHKFYYLLVLGADFPICPIH